MRRASLVMVLLAAVVLPAPVATAESRAMFQRGAGTVDTYMPDERGCAHGPDQVCSRLVADVEGRPVRRGSFRGKMVSFTEGSYANDGRPCGVVAGTARLGSVANWIEIQFEGTGCVVDMTPETVVVRSGYIIRDASGRFRGIEGRGKLTMRAINNDGDGDPTTGNLTYRMDGTFRMP